jgi:hypothetical protein
MDPANQREMDDVVNSGDQKNYQAFKRVFIGILYNEKPWKFVFWIIFKFTFIGGAEIVKSSSVQHNITWLWGPKTAIPKKVEVDFRKS